MNENDNFEFNFDDKIDDLFSSKKPSEEVTYEDIVSSSQAKEQMEFEDICSSSNGKKKRRNFKAWFKSLSKTQKGLLIAGTSLISLIIIAIIVVAIIIAVMWAKVHVGINYDEFNVPGVKEDGIVNMALFGVDTRSEEVFSGNTDSIMILSLNKKDKTIKIFSVMRDTLVPMNYKGDE